MTTIEGEYVPSTAAWVREQIATHCEPVLEDQQRTAQSKRYLQTRQEHDGTVRGSFVLASEDWESVATVLEPLARRDGLSFESHY